MSDENTPGVSPHSAGSLQPLLPATVVARRRCCFLTASARAFLRCWRCTVADCFPAGPLECGGCVTRDSRGEAEGVKERRQLDRNQRRAKGKNSPGKRSLNRRLRHGGGESVAE